MIVRCPDFDLGKDKTRIKDPRDAQRQMRTVEVLLDRMYAESPEARREIQILADDVGMGKTFVALGVAYSVLSAMANGSRVPDLEHCYQKVLIVSPQNAALFAKWQTETSEFVQRCVVDPQVQSEARRWFAPTKIERIDDLVAAVRRKKAGPRVLVTDMGLFAGRKLLDYDLKRRVLLGLLFRSWGNAFRNDQRARLLKGAPDRWPADTAGLLSLTEAEQKRLPFTLEELRSAIRRSEAGASDLVSQLLEICREIAKPFVRERDKKFRDVERLLADLYRALCVQMIRRSFPLVIVDEAHNWKNHGNGFKEFRSLIATRSRRALLLTATPFQLRPEELLRILELSDSLSCAPTQEKSEARQQFLRNLRTNTVGPVLKRSVESSRRFQAAWSKLPPSVDAETLDQIWQSAALNSARSELAHLAKKAGVAPPQAVDGIIEPAVAQLDPEVRHLFREGLRLFAQNCDLSAELGLFVIRHRRRTDHRLFRVGAEFAQKTHELVPRADAHVLHRSPGLDVRGEGELPHYLLMRCVSEMNDRTGRSSLGTALTGCYSTLLHSDEGRRLKAAIGKTPVGQFYLEMLLGMVRKEHDPSHPKVREVVDQVLSNWKAGEKTLIFCFRVNTAHRLRDIIDERIRAELQKRQSCCLGGKNGLVTLRQRLTSRERDLIPVGLDRVLWSLLWAASAGHLPPAPYIGDDLQLRDEELEDLAELAQRYGVDLTGERVDRVFLHRAIEHLVASRVLRSKRVADGIWKDILAQIAFPAWIEAPYGVRAEADVHHEGEETASFDEKGGHHVYEPLPKARHLSKSAEAVAESLQERRERAEQTGQISILDVYGRGPSLWFGDHPPSPEHEGGHAATLQLMHGDLWNLSLSQEGELNWTSRLLVMQALRRALLRTSVLLRLLPDQTELAEENWGVLLSRAFFEPLPGQHESMADRISVFLEDLRAAGKEARQAMLEATRLRDQQFVALVSGEKTAEEKSRIFTGFNTPLLPEVLVCTSVGQEGIDLHRHCRHVVHYDLAWNPATIEQRTGRTDRIGSKTFRERARENPVRLEVGVPFLAGTYDERMYEELRLRAQAFEVLTGGDLAADIPTDGSEDQESETLAPAAELTALPETMISDLRVRLHVWDG